MKALMRIALAILIIIAIPLIIALFIRNDYEVERHVKINQPVSAVYDYVKYLKNQDEFSKWAKMDPNMKKTYQGTDGMVGFVAAWESKNRNVGKGEQEIMKMVENQRIEYELRFREPFASNSQAYIATKPLGENETEVTWGIKGNMPYPTNLMFVFMDFDKMMGDDLQTGLDNLKDQLENK